jgi:DNA-binding NarL/FixJ family response regulator
MTETQPNGQIRTAIVEDDPTVIDRLEGALQGETDITVIGVARNFAQGRELVRRGGFDVLLCDLGLPDGSGINLIREAAKLYPTIDIMVITIFADQEKVLESIKAGARGYLLKDERLEECGASIREIVRGGSPISPMIARQLLRQFQQVAAAAASAPPDKRGELLTPRELEVLNLLSRGFSYAEIGGILTLSTQTIATYVKSIYRKMEVNSRSEAVFEASNMGLLNMGKSPQ